MGENKMSCVVGLDFGEHKGSQLKKHWKAPSSYGSL